MVKLGTNQTTPKPQAQLNVLQRITGYSIDLAPWLTLHEKYLVYNCLFQIVCFNKKRRLYMKTFMKYNYLKQFTLTEKKNTKTTYYKPCSPIINQMSCIRTLQQNFGQQISQSTRWSTVLWYTTINHYQIHTI